MIAADARRRIARYNLALSFPWRTPLVKPNLAAALVLAVVAGAMRRFFERRGVAVAAIDLRAFVPVSMRKPDERGGVGNRVASWIVDLPTTERDPVKRLARVTEATTRLKGSRQARGAEILTEVVDWTGSAVLSLAMWMAGRVVPYNMVVTNVPDYCLDEVADHAIALAFMLIRRIPMYVRGAREEDEPTDLD